VINKRNDDSNHERVNRFTRKHLTIDQKSEWGCDIGRRNHTSRSLLFINSIVNMGDDGNNVGVIDWRNERIKNEENE
jgi:hypothetical protein